MTAYLETDVLVIGGGGAGARAALEARRAGARVVLVVKGTLGGSGATALPAAETAAYNVADGALDPDDNPDEHFADIRDAALDVCDERLARILADEALDTMRFLERLGVRFEPDPRGGYLTLGGCFARRPRMHILRGHGEQIIRALSAEVRTAGVDVREFVTATDLLVECGDCLGAACLDASGEPLAIAAKATILATGGAAGLFVRNLAPVDVTGDGYGMSYRAGAELLNMEFMQIGFGLVHPFRNLVHCWVWGLHPRLLNGAGNPFLENYLPAGVAGRDVMDAKTGHYPFSCRDVSLYLELAIQAEIAAGRAGPHGGVLLDFSSVDESALRTTTPRGDDIAKVWPITREWYRARGIDLTTTPLEIAPFAHAINGGLRIDPAARTTIAGLYAVGETAGGPHGADRLGGNMLVGCQVFGRRAGIDAAALAAIRSRAAPSVPTIDATVALARGIACSAGGGNVSPDALRSDLQAAMTEGMLVGRSAAGMGRCLERIKAIRARLADACSGGPGGLAGVVELDNLLTVGEMMVRAALWRTESRGSHYRKDFPASDVAWSKSIVVRRAEGGMKLTKAVLPSLDGRGVL